MTLAPIQVHRFFSKFVPDPNNVDELIEEDWVEYGPIGEAGRSTTCDAIRRLKAVVKSDRNPASSLALVRWQTIEPKYEAWKAGRSADIDGTPLRAWPAVSEQHVSTFAQHGIYSVEQVAELGDTHLKTVTVPNLRRLIKDAQLFLEAKDKNRFVSELEKRDLEISSMAAQIDELKAMIRAGHDPAKNSEDAGYDESSNQSEDGSLAIENINQASAMDSQEIFETWEDGNLKDYIKSQTGQPVLGNPSHETLVKRAIEAMNPASEVA